MRERTAHDQAARSAGLGTFRRNYRVTRRIGYGLGTCLGAAALLLVGALGWTWWGFLIGAVAAAGVAWFYKVFPPSTGLRTVVRYEGGLVLVGAEGHLPALPWAGIESCEYVPARFEYRGNLQTEHVARVLLRVRGADEPLVLMHLGGRERELARAVDAALMPRRTAPLHRRYAEQGQVLFGTVLGVLPDGLLIGPSEYHHRDPLPWADLDLVGARGAGLVNLTATKDLNPGSRQVSCEVSDAPVVAAFVLEVCNAALGLTPSGVPVETQSG